MIKTTSSVAAMTRSLTPTVAMSCVPVFHTKLPEELTNTGVGLLLSR